jgi:hypothetical protein
VALAARGSGVGERWREEVGLLALAATGSGSGENREVGLLALAATGRGGAGGLSRILLR